MNLGYRSGAEDGMKDRIGNKLALGDKVAVQLPESAIFGFIAELKETGMVARVRGGGADVAPGHVLVSCVIALPVDQRMDAVAQVVKVYNADAEAQAAQGTSEPSKPN
jgi:hypothetical protein